jgi:hypothetical protein
MTPRPATLREIAARSESLEDFGRHLRDWLHEVRRITSRAQARQAIAAKPPILRDRLADGGAADAWLAAYAEHLAHWAGIAPPEWAFAPGRIASQPWFAAGVKSDRLRNLALREAPLPFKRRNVFAAAVELPLRLRAGRPAKTTAEKRRANADRQRRFRVRRAAELKALRKLAAGS